MDKINRSGPLFNLELVLDISLAFIVAMRIIVSGRINPWTIYLFNSFLAMIIIMRLLRRRGGIFISSRLVKSGLFLYFGAAFLSVFFSLSFWDSARWFFFHVGDLFLFLALVYAGKNRVIVVLSGLLTAGFITSGYALRQHFGGLENTLMLDGLSDYAIMTIKGGRVFGLASSPDMLAAILAGLVPVCLSLFFMGIRRRELEIGRISSLVSVLLLPVFVAVIYLTMSIGGILSAFIGAFCWAAMTYMIRNNKKISQKLIAGIFIAGIITAFSAGLAIHKRGGVFFNMKHHDNPIVMRIDNWRTGLLLWKEFPLTGAGGGQHKVAVLFHKLPESNEAKHAHNTFIEVLSETGPAGLLGIVLIVAGFLISGWGIINNSAESETDNDIVKELIPGIFSGGIAVFAHSMIDYDWVVPEVTTIFWVSLALVSVSGREPESDDKSTGMSSFKRAVIVSVLLIVVFIELYHTKGERLRQKAITYSREGKWSEVYETSERALEWDPTSSHMWSLKALAMSRISPGKDRTALINKSIVLSPRYPYNYRDLGQALSRRDEEAADAAFRKSVSLYPNNYNLNLHLGRWYVKQKKYDMALKSLKHAMICTKHNSDAALELGRIYILNNDEEEAKKYFMIAASSRFMRGQTVIQVSKWLKSQNHGKLSYSFLAEWIKNNPDSDELESVKKELQIYP